MAQRVLDALEELSRDLGIPVITPEYEILLTLLDAGSLASEELAGRSSLSRAAFFQALGLLKHWKFVTYRTDPADRRRKIYCLLPATTAIMIAAFRGFQGPYRRVTRSGLLPPAEPAAGSGAARAGLPHGWAGGPDPRMPLLSCELQILIHLCLQPGSANGEIAGSTSASRTKFNTAMRTLQNRGLITQDGEHGDRRRRYYEISEGVRHAIDRVNRQVVSWLDELGGS